MKRCGTSEATGPCCTVTLRDRASKAADACGATIVDVMCRSGPTSVICWTRAERVAWPRSVVTTYRWPKLGTSHQLQSPSLGSLLIVRLSSLETGSSRRPSPGAREFQTSSFHMVREAAKEFDEPPSNAQLRSAGDVWPFPVCRAPPNGSRKTFRSVAISSVGRQTEPGQKSIRRAFFNCVPKVQQEFGATL